MRAILAWAGIIIIVIIGLYVAWPLQVDDAFITFRYAKHAADGLGITWNAGAADPVEGFTTFLWMALMIIPHALSFSPLVFSKILGIISLGACGFMLYRYAVHLTGRSLIGYMAMLPLILLPATYYHTLSGMETMPFAACLLGLFTLGVECQRQPVTHRNLLFVGIPLLTLISGMMRPEGLLPGLVVLVLLAARTPRELRSRLFLYIGLFLVLPGVVYFIWRWLYFGWLLPNTFYVKFGDLSGGVKWAISIAALLGPMLAILLFSYVFAKRDAVWPRFFLYGAGFIVAAALPYFNSQLTMNYLNRFLFHFLPCVFLLTALGFDVLVKMLPPEYARGRRVNLFATAALALMLLPFLHNDRLEIAHMTLYGPYLETAHVAVARALAEADVPGPDRTLAVGDAGAIPYYADWQAIDFIGLNDEYIAHHPRERTASVAGRRPSVLILYSGDGLTLRDYQFDLDVNSLLPDYDFITGVRMYSHYYLNIYLRRDVDSAAAERLAADLREVSHQALAANVFTDNTRGMVAYLKHRFTKR